MANKSAARKVIDTHMHLDPDQISLALNRMEENNLYYGIIMGQGGEDAFYQQAEAIKPYPKSLGIMYVLPWKLAATEADFFTAAPDRLEKAVKAGALGLKSFKELGLVHRDTAGTLIPIDDPRLFPVWERAEKLGVVVAFHTGDPKAFFEPWNAQNERWGELELHPEWSFADRSKYPAREELHRQRNNVIRRFPRIRFHGCHVANNPEDLITVAAWLQELPNLFIDVAARVGELGRYPAREGHDFFTRFQNRAMFGTDYQYYTKGQVQGAGPCRDFTEEEYQLFCDRHWWYFESNFRKFDHPTPTQGKWKIEGIKLDPPVLRKIYWENAHRLYRLDRFGVV
jgi:predicted TIM-barrel fold metal-dependent hydrolase